MAPDGDLLRAGEAARLLGVSRPTLYRWTEEGRLRCFLIGPHKERRYAKRDIRALIEERRAADEQKGQG